MYYLWYVNLITGRMKRGDLPGDTCVFLISGAHSAEKSAVSWGQKTRCSTLY